MVQASLSSPSRRRVRDRRPQRELMSALEPRTLMSGSYLYLVQLDAGVTKALTSASYSYASASVRATGGDVQKLSSNTAIVQADTWQDAVGKAIHVALKNAGHMYSNDASSTTADHFVIETAAEAGAGTPEGSIASPATSRFRYRRPSPGQQIVAIEDWLFNGTQDFNDAYVPVQVKAISASAAVTANANVAWNAGTNTISVTRGAAEIQVPVTVTVKAGAAPAANVDLKDTLTGPNLQGGASAITVETPPINAQFHFSTANDGTVALKVHVPANAQVGDWTYTLREGDPMLDRKVITLTIHVQ